MSNSNVLLFGSFTEDETRSLVKTSSSNDVKPSQNEIKLTSFQAPIGNPIGVTNVEFNRQPNRPSNLSEIQFSQKRDPSKGASQLSAPSKKDEKSVCVKKVNDILSEVSKAPNDNVLLKKLTSFQAPIGNPIGVTNVESNRQPNRPSNLSKIQFSQKRDPSKGASQLSAPSKKDEKSVCVKKENDTLPEVSKAPNDNVFLKKSSHISSLGNDVKEIKNNRLESTTPGLPQKESITNHFSSLNLHAPEDDKDYNGSLDVPSTHMATILVTQKNYNGSIAHARSLLPRGLLNSGNLCFLNATLQALLSCSPFVHLLQELRNNNIPKVEYPTLTAFTEFISDFDMPGVLNLKKNETPVFETGMPFRPSMFECVLKKFTPDVSNSISSRPRQEDAQEFLSFIMDEMHGELLKLEGQVGSLSGSKSCFVSHVEDDEWETVGRKNKSAITRTQSFVPSELSAIFGGQLRSVVTARGNKASATVQPYLLLHLDILPDVVRNVEDALRLFSAPETLEGYRSSATGKPGVVDARKSMKIQTLSKVLILHLMRFSYGSQGSTKLHKSVRFPLQLVLGRELLVSPSSEGRKYELVATITHHGRDPSKGHYTADARYPDGHWLRFDDASVTGLGKNRVLHDQAYVLFYKQV